MTTHSLIALIASAAAALTAPAIANAQETTTMDAPTKAAPAPKKTGHLAVNGVNYYYEVRGEGEPLLLLHGGLGSIDMFAPLMPIFAEGREVIAVDLHGHGRTTLGDRAIDYLDMGDDMATILKKLGYGKVDVLGYSMGGGIALRLAVQHPEAVRRLVIASVPFAQDGFFPELLPQQAAVGAGMAEAMKGTPMYETYMALAPHPEDFPRLLDNMGALLRRPYNWAADVKTLNMPVMLVFGDSDMVRPEHVVEFYHLLGGGLKDAGWQREHMPQARLAILPDLTHYEAFMAPALASAALPFLNGKSNAPNWAEQVRETR
jgi:pimeloyl-ACP methyl ester carboxylesterase